MGGAVGAGGQGWAAARIPSGFVVCRWMMLWVFAEMLLVFSADATALLWSLHNNNVAWFRRPPSLARLLHGVSLDHVMCTPTSCVRSQGQHFPNCPSGALLRFALDICFGSWAIVGMTPYPSYTARGYPRFFFPSYLKKTALVSPLESFCLQDVGEGFMWRVAADNTAALVLLGCVCQVLGGCVVLRLVLVNSPQQPALCLRCARTMRKLSTRCYGFERNQLQKEV